ncbi:MAG TPA: HNH endonuclease, partial [Kofleriaceae bacterium]|nr:HNH endonuclease [Kofleriaceae bacterium]
MSRRHLLLLAAAVTDSTFTRATLDDRRVWVGKCIHCNSKLVIADDGKPLGEATLEHVFPTTQGGTNTVANLAVACARCNREKGTRHDHRGGERLDHVVALLRARRQAPAAAAAAWSFYIWLARRAFARGRLGVASRRRRPARSP